MDVKTEARQHTGIARQGRRFAAVLALALAGAPAWAAPLAVDPHEALYNLTLQSARAASGVVAANGAMFYKWGETCDGWTLEQRFRLRISYAEEDPTDISSTLVTFESKDGLRYRFNERRLRNGELDAEIRGEAHLDGPGKGGIAEFTKPEAATLRLRPGVLFPTAHTLALIAAAEAHQQFISRYVFDGSEVENAGEISAFIGAPLTPPGPQAPKPLNAPLLQHKSWRMRLAFFPASDSGSSDQTEPDYELSMRLLENGVSQDMKLDYGDYVIAATLSDIKALPRPGC
ncbi:MAG: cell envelope integrity EipB family protein [Alphaproteobacteria bacterium]|nr:cell envelope integrity EipB family protein [Alphaproteobacteria bacterium]